MFLSKEKRAPNPKVLTESEIKRRLYGEYETVSGGGASDIHDSKIGSDEVIPPKRISTGLSDRQGPVAATRKSPEPLFSSSPKPSFSSSSVSQVKPDAKTALLGFGKNLLGVCSLALWKVGGWLVKGLELILKLLDPRKPQARKVLYSITACVLVFALFVGVFRLNSQRKKAMLGELPVATQGIEERSTAADASATQSVGPSAVTPSTDSEGVTNDATTQKEESQEMILKALENATPTQAASASVSAGRYVIQVATYAIVEDANRIIQSLTQAGFEAFYKKQIRNSNKASFFTVCLGRFENYAAAQEVLAKFRKSTVARPFQDAFIRTLE